MCEMTNGLPNVRLFSSESCETLSSLAVTEVPDDDGETERDSNPHADPG